MVALEGPLGGSPAKMEIHRLEWPRHFHPQHRDRAIWQFRCRRPGREACNLTANGRPRKASGFSMLRMRRGRQVDLAHSRSHDDRLSNDCPTDGSAGSPSGSVDTGTGRVLSTRGPRLKVIGVLHAQVGGPVEVKDRPRGQLRLPGGEINNRVGHLRRRRHPVKRALAYPFNRSGVKTWLFLQERSIRGPRASSSHGSVPLGPPELSGVARWAAG
jgi:hypothetical protein